MSLAWTVAASVAAGAIGLATGSLSLLAFGGVGVLDAVGSLALVLHFRHAVRHERMSHARDGTVLIVVATGMILIALATAGTAVHRLTEHATVDEGLTGAYVAGPSVVALAVLGAGKRRVGRRVRSRALVADGLVSSVGAVFASIVLAGLAANALAHWWWFDPVGSVAIAIGAVGLAITSLRGEPITDRATHAPSPTPP